MPKTSRKQTQSIQDKVIKEIESLPDKKTLFTEFEDNLIRKYYPIKGCAIAKTLGKTPRQVISRASYLTVKLNKRYGR